MLAASSPMILCAASLHKSHNEKQTSSPTTATTKTSTHCTREISLLIRGEGRSERRGKTGKEKRDAGPGIKVVLRKESSRSLEEPAQVLVSLQTIERRMVTCFHISCVFVCVYTEQRLVYMYNIELYSS